MSAKQIQKDIIKVSEIAVSSAVVSTEMVMLFVGLWIFTT